MTMMTEDDFAALYHELAVEFVAEIMQVTYGADTTAAFQQALQTYVDELRPWLCGNRLTVGVIDSTRRERVVKF